MGLPAKMILEFFHQEDGQWAVNEDITKMVEFRRYNMLDNLTFTSEYEVIFCRNVLRYFTTEHRQNIIKQISRCQPKGGILYLGKNEYIPEINKFYTKLDGYNCVYTNNGNSIEKPKLSASPDTETFNAEMPSFVRPEIFTRKAQ